MSEPMVSVTAMSAQIAAVAAQYSADELRKVAARNPAAAANLTKAADAQERAAKELQAAVNALASRLKGEKL